VNTEPVYRQQQL